MTERIGGSALRGGWGQIEKEENIMPKFIVDADIGEVGDGELTITIDVHGINPKNEAKAAALVGTLKVILADGKIDLFEAFAFASVVSQLGKL